MTDLKTHEAWVRDVLRQYEEPLLRYARRLTGNAETARDVVQDTFVRLCAANRSDVESRLAPWLYTVCRNRAFDVREKEARMRPMEKEEAERQPNLAPPPSAVAEVNERHALVLGVLEALPQNQQEAFRLKFQQNLTYREISQILGVSLGTVNTLVTSALFTLRSRLEAVAER
jgi:RNA polymerase sigma-70 factor (ECF subfamily)